MWLYKKQDKMTNRQTKNKYHPMYSVQDLAEDRLGNGYLGESHELITDALNTMLQVYGPLHSDIESSHK